MLLYILFTKSNRMTIQFCDSWIHQMSSNELWVFLICIKFCALRGQALKNQFFRVFCSNPRPINKSNICLQVGFSCFRGIPVN